VVAQGWDFDLVLPRNVQNRLSRFRFDFLTIERDIHGHVLVFLIPVWLEGDGYS
jgi:hypothetical protein